MNIIINYKFILSIYVLLTLSISFSNVSQADYKVVDDFIFDGFSKSVPRSYRTESFTKYLIYRFGKIRNSDKKIVPDLREPGLQIAVTNLIFDGIAIKIYTPFVGERLNTWVKDIVITSDKYLLKHGLKIGSEKSEFIKVLGKPDDNFGSIFEYTSYEGGSAKVKIEFDSSLKAKKISWIYGSD